VDPGRGHELPGRPQQLAAGLPVHAAADLGGPAAVRLRVGVADRTGAPTMSIELNEEQRQAVLKGEPVRVPAPGIGQDLGLLRGAPEFEEIRDGWKEERERRAVAAVARRNAARRVIESDCEPV